MADQKPGGSEAALGWGILGCVFAALGYLVWSFFSTEIKSAIRWLRYAEMWVAGLFLPDDYTVVWQGQKIPYNELMRFAKAMPPNRLDNEFIGVLSAVGMQPYQWVVIAIFLLFGTWALFKGPGSEHRQSFDLDSLIKKQANIFPIIAPFISFNPTKQPPRAPGSPVPAELPSFAEALGPEEWLAYNTIPVPDQKIDEDAAAKAFAKQLGPRWKGVQALAPYKQVLIAAFILKAGRKRADSDDLLGRLALCWSHEKGLQLSKDRTLLREARAILKNRALSEKFIAKCNQHAWETTAMMRALVTAREEGGVLAPAQFVWLRAHDRVLWYPLNNIGRQSFHMEAVGAMAHYKAEKMAQRPIPRPKMGDAVKTIAEYMTSTRARAIPQLDYSNSKKSGIKKLKNA